MRLNVCYESCCDVCGRIIHNDFDCPACGTKRVDAEESEEIYDFDNIITCSKCGAKFQCVNGSPYDEDSEWERIDTK